MKKTILLCLLALSFMIGKSQSYAVNQISYNPFPFDSGIAIVSPTDDLWGDVLGIGFDFYFFGVPYQNLVVGTNGVLSFNTGSSGSFSSWNITGPVPASTPADMQNSIMFPWQDLDCTNMGRVRHQVYGTPPNRRFIVSFDSIPFYGAPNSVNNSVGCNPAVFTGQIILYEGSSNIEVYIENKDTCQEWNNGFAIEGIQNAASTYTVPGRNATVWTAYHDAWQFSPDAVWRGPLNLNRISGRVIADLNSDCQYNGLDYALRNKPVVFTNDSTSAQSYIYTDLLGYYSKLVDTGHYTFSTSNLANNLYASNCPVGGDYHVYFPVYIDSSDNNLFADTVTEYCSALQAGLWVSNPNSYLGAINSCDTAVMSLTCTNNGSVNDSVTLLLTLNDSTQIFSSSTPYTKVGNVYSFDAGVITAGSNFSISLSVKVGCDTSGTLYCFGLQAQGAYPIQCLGSSGSDYLCGLLGQPFDPNAMYVSSITTPGVFVPYLETTDSDVLSYVVTFQNTGTGVAHNVKLQIPLSARIDTNSLAPIMASASYSWLVLNHTLIVDFNNINLPYSTQNLAGSEGFFKFTVRQAAGNYPGDSIIHKAGIYFDYNVPVITNNAIVTIGTNGITTGTVTLKQAGISIYPNPAHTQVQLNTKELSQVKIMDATGKIMLSQQLTSLNTNFDVSNWASGMYLIMVNSEQYNGVVKFIKN